MKNLLLICLTLCGAHASAYVMSQSELLAVCSAQVYTADKQECAKLIQTGLFDSDAVNFCQTAFVYSSDKSSCMKLVINKKYDSAMVSFCAGQTYSSDKMSCLRDARSTSLSVKPQPGMCSTRQTKRSVSRILYALQAGAYDAAEILTQNLLNQLSQIEN